MHCGKGIIKAWVFPGAMHSGGAIDAEFGWIFLSLLSSVESMHAQIVSKMPSKSHNRLVGTYNGPFWLHLSF